MRKILWVFLLFGAYIWLLTSGNDQMVLDKGKALYQTIITWLEDADIDYHLEKDSKKKKSSHRW